jgi:hypothetical protein
MQGKEVQVNTKTATHKTNHLTKAMPSSKPLNVDHDRNSVPKHVAI